jgi:hypothetical protein
MSNRSYLLVVLLALGGLLSNCSQPSNPGAPIGNSPPRTRLANLPINDPEGRLPSATPTVTLSWVGDDPDGFVTAFRYRWSYKTADQGTVYRDWTTLLNVSITGVTMIVKGDPSAVPDIYHYFVTLSPAVQDSVVNVLFTGGAVVVAGDSVVAANPKMILNPNVGSFIFESEDTLNEHTFEVKAMDNLGVEDPHPATVVFWTPKALPPDTRLVAPFPADSAFVIDKLTDTFEGLKFYYEGLDLKSKRLEYSWSVDSLRWSPFSSDQVAIVTVADMKQPYTGPHTFYVKARNDYNLQDSTPAYYTFRTVVPTFIDPSQPHRLLILTCTRNGNGNLGFPSVAQINAFYGSLLDAAGKAGTYDTWATTIARAFPSRAAIAGYSTIIVNNDAQNGDVNGNLTAANGALLSEYLSVGGKLIVSAWKTAERFDTTFAKDRFHIQTFTTSGYYRMNTAFDFTGGRGLLGYPDVQMDTTKMLSLWGGALANIPFVSPRGFAERIFTYESKTDSLPFQGNILGIRYLGITYTVVYLGFPLFYAQPDQASAIMKKALQDCGE